MPDPASSPLPIAFPGGQLRRLRQADLAAFQAYRSIPELGRFQGWSIMSDADADAFIARMSDLPLFPPDDWIQLAICDPSDRLIGDIGLFLSADGRSGHIGFTLAPSAQGRGIATAAVRKALGLFFGLTGAERVLGITDARNTASVRLLQRVGFRYCESRRTLFRGETCSEEIYAVHRNDS